MKATTPDEGWAMICRMFEESPNHETAPVIGKCHCGVVHDNFFTGDMAKVNGVLWVFHGEWKSAEEWSAMRHNIELPKIKGANP